VELVKVNDNNGQCNVAPVLHETVCISCSAHAIALTAERRVVACGYSSGGQCKVR
jgi:hypothetical protein